VGVVTSGLLCSGINDVAYMGDVVNSAAKLGAKGGMGPWEPGPLVAVHNRNDHNKGLLPVDVF
jgi:hypothetical protein